MQLKMRILIEISINFSLIKNTQMGSITRTLGRLLFVTIIASSAYLHLSKPQNYIQQFSNNYSDLHQCLGKYFPGFLSSPETMNWVLLTKIFGLFEVLTACLIFFGDCWGGFFLFVSLIISGYFDYKDICTIIEWNASRQVEFAQWVFFLGASLVLMQCSKKACNKNSCSEKSIGKEDIKQKNA